VGRSGLGDPGLYAGALNDLLDRPRMDGLTAPLPFKEPDQGTVAAKI
jgi:hypothetical protein